MNTKKEVQGKVLTLDNQREKSILYPSTLEYLQSVNFKDDIFFLYHKLFAENFYFERILHGFSNSAVLVYTEKTDIKTQKDNLKKVDEVCKYIDDNLIIYKQILKLLPQVKRLCDNQKPCKIIAFK